MGECEVDCERGRGEEKKRGRRELAGSFVSRVKAYVNNSQLSESLCQQQRRSCLHAPRLHLSHTATFVSFKFRLRSHGPLSRFLLHFVFPRSCAHTHTHTHTHAEDKLGVVLQASVCENQAA
eukprot:2870083-Rhodomonas_salina.1